MGYLLSHADVVLAVVLWSGVIIVLGVVVAYLVLAEDGKDRGKSG